MNLTILILQIMFLFNLEIAKLINVKYVENGFKISKINYHVRIK